MKVNHLHTTYVREGYAFEANSDEYFAQLLKIVTADLPIASVIGRAAAARVQGERLCKAIYHIEPVLNIINEDEDTK